MNFSISPSTIGTGATIKRGELCVFVDEVRASAESGYLALYSNGAFVGIVSPGEASDQVKKFFNVKG